MSRLEKRFDEGVSKPFQKDKLDVQSVRKEVSERIPYSMIPATTSGG